LRLQSLNLQAKSGSRPSKALSRAAAKTQTKHINLTKQNMCHESDCEHGDEACFPEFAEIGQKAPDFHLEGYLKGEKRHFSLEDSKGKWTLLFFYPLDFTFVCPTELIELSKRVKEFEALNAQVLGCSVDSVYSHEAWLKEIGDFDYPLLSDMTKEVSAQYGVLIPEKGIALRGAFIISPDGILKSMTINDLEIGRSLDELLRTIGALQTGELCAVGWKKGDKTLGKA